MKMCCACGRKRISLCDRIRAKPANDFLFEKLIFLDNFWMTGHQMQNGVHRVEVLPAGYTGRSREENVIAMPATNVAFVFQKLS